MQVNAQIAQINKRNDELKAKYKPAATPNKTAQSHNQHGSQSPTADGKGQVFILAAENNIDRNEKRNPNASLAGGCKQIDMTFSSDPQIAYEQLDSRLKELGRNEGNAEGKLAKIVISCHGYNGKVYFETSPGKLVQLEATRVAAIAAKHTEKYGEVVLAGCMIAPDKKQTNYNNDEAYTTDPVRGKQVQQELARVADREDVNIKFSGNDFWAVGGDQNDINHYARSDVRMATPDGRIVRDNSRELERQRQLAEAEKKKSSWSLWG